MTVVIIVACSIQLVVYAISRSTYYTLIDVAIPASDRWLQEPNVLKTALHLFSSDSISYYHYIYHHEKEAAAMTLMISAGVHRTALYCTGKPSSYNVKEKPSQCTLYFLIGLNCLVGSEI